MPILRPASSRPSFTGAGVVGWPGWLLCSEVGTFFALGAGPRAVVVDNHTPEKRALARGTWLERVIPTQTTLRTCRLTSGRLSTAGTRRGEGGKCRTGPFLRGSAGGGADALWLRLCSARLGQGICPDGDGHMQGLLGFPGKPCGRGGPFRAPTQPLGAGDCLQRSDDAPECCPVQEKRHLRRQGALACPAGGGRAPPAGRREEGSDS